MSKLNRFDVYIGILDDTNDLIKRAENQYKFEKYLTDFLNTNIYSKDKKWVFGTDRQISQHCKHKIDTIFGLQNKITDLKSQLSEKDVEIKKLNACVNFYKSYYISFNEKVIDELEKVKDIILNERKITSFKFDIFNKGKDTALFWLNEQIDNQINGLKGEK